MRIYKGTQTYVIAPFLRLGVDLLLLAAALATQVAWGWLLQLQVWKPTCGRLIDR